MLKLFPEEVARLEPNYPGITAEIRSFEDAAFPACPHCDSADTARIQCGLVGRTISIASATTKFKLFPNGPAPGSFFCNKCQDCFG